MLYIVRHGETAKNKQKLLQGRSDFPLNEKGRDQAAQVGQMLGARGITVDSIYTSPLVRAVETAQLIAHGMGADDALVNVENRLIEMDYGPYEGMSLEDPAPEVMAFFMDFAGTPAPDGMEQLHSVVARLGEFLEDIKEEARTSDVLLSAHAISMKGALEYLTPDSNGSYWSTNIGNCEVYEVEVSDDGYGIPHPLLKLKGSV
ncbi:MAG: histidine phosphatase family protein [Clostridiales bacterium]|nr:histidine phosphatase family protein [Clostridiales bacterium]